MVDLKPWGELNTEDIEEANIMVMGIPFDGAVSCGRGSALAPERIRALSRYLPPTTETGIILDHIKIYDSGDVAVDLNWEKYYKQVEEKAFFLFKEGKFCIFIGGDHSVTIPLTRAYGDNYKGKKIGVIHFDSHPDLCNEYDGHKWSHACCLRRTVEEVITPSSLAQVGIRSFENEELSFYKQNSDILLLKAYDLFVDGWKIVCEKLKKKFQDYDAVYISLDIDVLDPAFAPGTGTPDAGGLTTRELLEIIKFLMKELPIVAMDIVEVSPPLDSRQQHYFMGSTKNYL